MSDLFVGMWVDVEGEIRSGRRNSEGGRGMITNINENNSVSIKYTISNLMSPDVKSARVRQADFILSGRGSNADGSPTPSFLSHLYGAHRGSADLMSSREYL